MYKNSVLHEQSPFLLVRPTPLSITRFHIFIEQAINIIERFPFSLG